MFWRVICACVQWFNGISMFTTSSGQPMLSSNEHQYFVADVPQVTITLNIRDMDAYLVSIALVVLQAQCNIITHRIHVCYIW